MGLILYHIVEIYAVIYFSLIFVWGLKKVI